jgi:hypothetical protein
VEVEEEQRQRQRGVEVRTPAEAVVVLVVVAGAVREGLVGGERFEVGRIGKGVGSGG